MDVQTTLVPECVVTVKVWELELVDESCFRCGGLSDGILGLNVNHFVFFKELFLINLCMSISEHET